LKRLWDGYENLELHAASDKLQTEDPELEARCVQLIADLTIHERRFQPQVLANMFEMVPLINSMKDKTIGFCALGKNFQLL
jgi:cysteinyl-tRNA synthetase